MRSSKVEAFHHRLSASWKYSNKQFQIGNRYAEEASLVLQGWTTSTAAEYDDQKLKLSSLHLPLNRSHLTVESNPRRVAREDDIPIRKWRQLFIRSYHAYSLALQTNPYHYGGHGNLASLLSAGNHLDCATLHELKESLELNKFGGRYSLGGSTLLQIAIFHLQRSLAISWTYDNALNTLGLLFFRNRMYGEALHAYVCALMVNPRNTFAGLYRREKLFVSSSMLYLVDFC